MIGDGSALLESQPRSRYDHYSFIGETTLGKLGHQIANNEDRGVQWKARSAA